MNYNELINNLIDYGIDNHLITELDSIYIGNLVIDLIKEKEFNRVEKHNYPALPVILKGLCDIACAKGLIEDTITDYDLFDTRIMGFLTPHPSVVYKNFLEQLKISYVYATDYFYDVSLKSNYIRKDRIDKNICYKADTKYGKLDITINLSKPEKSLKEIEAARLAPQNGYPKCLLCKENMGFAGTATHPARQNLRLIPLKLNGENWYMQYSPYTYYNEHTIILNENHFPMRANSSTILALVDFIDQFPHYFMGSNAGIPIAGGSILSHDHFQGGRYRFAMFDAKDLKEIKIKDYDDVHITYVNWPMDVIRLRTNNRKQLIDLAIYIMDMWTEYEDIEHEIYAYTNGIRHNAVTPIARFENGTYVLDLVLRNNRTSEEFPEGIFHPNRSLHHIKKENIGLIEVAGLAVLPGRLKDELEPIKLALIDNSKANLIDPKHYEWFLELKEKYPSVKQDDVDEIVRREVANKFMQVLECCSVFRYGDREQNFDRFIKYLNM